MEFRPKKAIEINIVMIVGIICTVILVILGKLIDSYTTSTLLYVIFFAVFCYQLYYLGALITLRYVVTEEGIYITRVFGLRKTFISKEDLKGYEVKKGKIDGIKLWGYNLLNISYGKCYVKKIGLTKLFLSYNREVIYLITDNLNYGVSPKLSKEFIKDMEEKLGVKEIEVNRPLVKHKLGLYKDKKFIILFLISTIICFIVILTPLVLYLKGSFPDVMPLSFNTKFQAIVQGTDKQFVSQQMMYGVLNMAINICLYYAGHFTAKFDKTTAYKYIYMGLLASIVFLLMQWRTLAIFL